MALFKNQGQQKPTALGTLLQASAYGATIPKIYGMTQSPLNAIWAANLRPGGGNIKKFKQFKKGITNYQENIDFILGHNPIRYVNQLWINGAVVATENMTETATTLNGEPYATPGFVAGPEYQFLVPDGGGGFIADPLFVTLVAVTFPASYSFDVDDYGGQGPETLSGDWEIPLWNALEQGPNPTRSSLLRFFPLCYRWQPGYGVSFFVDFPDYFEGGVKAYFTNYVPGNSSAINNAPPLAAYDLEFENELGNGPEYASAPSPFDEQQIIYPQFAGLGSSTFNLGSTGALPQILPEVEGKWGVYGSGDCDFVDIIEDVFKSGLAQAALGAETAYTQMETGLSSYNLPGVVQVNTTNSIFGIPDGEIAFNMPTTLGNFLVVLACGESSGATLAISDTAGSTWTPIFPAGSSIQAWYAQCLGGADTITVDGWTGFNQQIAILEVGGVDTFDSVSVGANGTTQLTSTNQQNFPGYILNLALWNTPINPGTGTSAILSDPSLVQWETFLDGENSNSALVGYGGGSVSPYQLILERIVKSPTTVNSKIATATSQPLPVGVCMIAFKAVQPVAYPSPLGDFFDFDSHELVRAQCRANGLFGSLSMSQQSPASDWLTTLYQAADAAPVFLGSKLYGIPYSEVSAAGNGAFYTSPTASGPVAALSTETGDFTTGNTPNLKTVNRIDLPNVLQLQIISRDSNYNQIVVSQPESASIALYGVRKADPVVNNAIQDANVARMILGIMVRKNQYGGDVYSFSVTARWSLLSPMDLVTIADPLANIPPTPVRLTSIEEKDDGSLDCEAEPFIYGMYAPTPFTTTSPNQYLPAPNVGVGDVNPPIIFEPTPGLYPQFTGDQLWCVVSSPDEEYGGCAVYVSTDGGSTYNPAPGLGGASGPSNIVTGSAVTGALTADWPAATDPDSTNNLSVDLTESNGELESYPVAAENNFEYPCYVQAETFGVEVAGSLVANGQLLGVEIDGTAIAALGTVEVDGTAVAEAGSASFNYELMTYAVATNTAPFNYELMATGSGNFLRRAVLDAPNSSGDGVDHATGSRFALLNPTGTGILKMAMPTVYIGQTLYFKFLSFNGYGAALQSLADVPAYSYTPTGIPGMA